MKGGLSRRPALSARQCNVPRMLADDVRPTLRELMELTGSFAEPESDTWTHSLKAFFCRSPLGSARRVPPAILPDAANRSNLRGLSPVRQSCMNRVGFAFPESPNIGSRRCDDRQCERLGS